MASRLKVHLPEIPDSIPRETLRAICDLIGVPADDVRTLDINVDTVYVTLYARDEAGGKLCAGSDAVVAAVSIPVI